MYNYTYMHTKYTTYTGIYMYCTYTSMYMHMLSVQCPPLLVHYIYIYMYVYVRQVYTVH